MLSILRALDDAAVDYVVVGGVAVVLRGHARMTVDLDLALDLTAENATAVLEVLIGCGLRPRLPVPARDFADAELRGQWVEQRHLIAFTMHDPDDALREVDLLATSPIPYADLAADADRFTIEGVTVPVASLAHLLAMKRHAGRPQDLADIAALSALQRPPMVDGDDRDRA
ncbi:hypothetical protein BH23ACT6_BH23ACT6_20210 [soil metagenome]